MSSFGDLWCEIAFCEFETEHEEEMETKFKLKLFHSLHMQNRFEWFAKWKAMGSNGNENSFSNFNVLISASNVFGELLKSR